MHKKVLENISGIDIYPVIGLIIFFIFFIAIMIWIITLKKNYIDKMSRLPLETTNKKEN
jgi:cbb3-type cytochrome oxidase subunit 3